MTQPAKFWDKHAVKYAASPIKDQAAYEYTLERTRSYLKKDDHVLELGSGTGSTALLLAKDAAEITGTDISPEMMRIALEKAAVQGADNLRFQVRTAASAAEQSSGMDVVMALNILHLTEGLEGILATLHDKMAPGSLLISKTPCLAEPSIGVKRFAFGALVPVMQFFGIAPYVRQLSFHELEAAIGWAGFKIIETGSYPAMSRFIVARRT